MPSPSTASVICRRRLRTTSRAVSARLAKCVEAPRAATPPARVDIGIKRYCTAWSSRSSSVPAIRARAKPSPAPARKTHQRRRVSGVALFLFGDMAAVAFFELAAEEAGAFDQVQPLARGLARRSLDRGGILDRLGHRSLTPGGLVGVEAA